MCSHGSGFSIQITDFQNECATTPIRLEQYASACVRLKPRPFGVSLGVFSGLLKSNDTPTCTVAAGSEFSPKCNGLSKRFRMRINQKIPRSPLRSSPCVGSEHRQPRGGESGHLFLVEMTALRPHCGHSGSPCDRPKADQQRCPANCHGKCPTMGGKRNGHCRLEIENS